jgi:hypothetical protein
LWADAEQSGQKAQPKYQLYYEEVTPCRWYLSVDGGEEQRIEPHELTVQSRFRIWHLNNRYKPPQTEKDGRRFEEMIEGLYDAAIKRDKPLPFLQTDADHIETLISYFDFTIPSMVRSKGQKFLDGKFGDWVRLKLDLRRICFKWQMLKLHCQRRLNFREKELEALKMFISKKGGYQGEQGARDWWRWTYWVPMDIFDGATLKKWLEPDTWLNPEKSDDGGTRE